MPNKPKKQAPLQADTHASGAPRHVCEQCPRLATSPWPDLNRAGMAEFERARMAFNFASGNMLVSGDDASSGVYCIKSGTVGVRRTDRGGNSMVVRLLEPGAIVASLSASTWDQTSISVEALTRVAACFVSWPAIERLFESNPSVASSLVRTAFKCLQRAEESLLRTASLSVRVRLAAFLLELRDQHGVVDDDGILRIELPMSRTALASCLATRPETLARAIRELETAEVAVFGGRTVVIADLDALLDEVEP